MTAHWIIPNTIQRQSASIAMRRITGSHTSEVLSENIQNVLVEYNIHSKISKIVTDNGSNFVKAMKPPTDKENNNVDVDIQPINLTRILRNSSNDNIPLHQRCACHTLYLCMTTDIKTALKQALKENNEKENELNENECFEKSIFEDDDFDSDVSIIDSAALNYKKASESSLGKCKSIWHKQSKSTVASDLIKDTLGNYLNEPNDPDGRRN